MPDDGQGCGSGSGSGGRGWEIPADMTLDGGAGEAVSAADGDLLRRQVARDIVAHAAATGRGTVPGGWARWADGTLAPAVVPWTRVLRATVRRVLADRAGLVDYTYRRPSRRQHGPVIRPAMRAPSLAVSIVIDTSGSMGQGDLDAAMSEVVGVLSASGVRREAVTCPPATPTPPPRAGCGRCLRLSWLGVAAPTCALESRQLSRPVPHRT